jgi:radical SAM family protein
MVDVVLINPAGYSGTARRGPYELAVFQSQLIEAGISAELFDIQQEVGNARIPYPHGHIPAVMAKIAGLRARVYIITIRTSAGPWAHGIAKAIKAIYADCIIAAYAPRIEKRIRRVMLKDNCFDVLLVPTPARSMISLVSALLEINDASVEALQALASTTQECSPKDNDPAPARQQNAGSYEIGIPWISADRTIAAVNVGRGCPDRCTFCAAPIGLGGSPRYAPAEQIAKAAQSAFDGLDLERRLFVMLETENLTSNRLLVREIAQERERNRYDFLWGAYGRIDHMDDEFQQFLATSGCRFLFFGIESASPRLLKILGKHFDPNSVLQKLHSLKKLGITTQSSLMFGIPTETFDEFIETVGLAAEIAWMGGYIDLTPMRIEAGTPMERMTAHHPLRMMRNNELFHDLTEAGIIPEHCNPDMAYRIYALDLPGFDIDSACLSSKRLRIAFMHWPLTTYILHHGLQLSIRYLANFTANHLTSGQGRVDHLWMQTLLDEQPVSAKAFLSEMFEFERTLWEFDGVACAQGRPSHYMIEPLYETLRSNPAAIPRVFGLPWWSASSQSSNHHSRLVLNIGERHA